MANLNYARFLPDLLASLQRQTLEHWQCIVVDDGSTDGSVELIQSAAEDDPRFVLVTKPGGGPAGALRAALPWASGDVIAFVDSDDALLPSRLHDIVAAFRAEPDAGMVVHPLHLIGSDGVLLGRTPLRGTPLHGDLRPQLLTLGGRVGGMGVTSGMAIRRSIVDWLAERSLLPERGTLPDEFLRRVAPLLAPVAAIEHPLGLRRVHGQNISTSSVDRLAAFVQRAYDEQVDILRRQNEVLSALGSTHRFRDDHDLDLLTLAYATARLTGSAETRADAARSLRSAPTFQALRGIQRWFWTLAPRTPTRVFAPLLSVLLSPNGIKPLLNHLRFRIGRSDEAAPGLTVASTREVFRRALRRRW